MFVLPTSINTVRQLLPLHLSRPELQLFIASDLKKFVIPRQRSKQIGLSSSGLACVAGSFVFRVGKWAGEARQRMRKILLLPLVCPRFARVFTAHLRERRDHQLQQLHVNLYQFYYFIWLLLVTKKQSISNRSLRPFFSAPFLSLIYPWVFSAGFLLTRVFSHM